MTDIIINFWAVLGAAVGAMIVGFVWYAQAVFGKAWMKAIGKNESDLKKDNMAGMFLLTFIGALVTAYVLAHLVKYTNATTVSLGLQAGFWSWLGFVAPTTGANYLFEGKPFNLYLITAGHQLVALLLMGAILAAWG